MKQQLRRALSAAARSPLLNRASRPALRLASYVLGAQDRPVIPYDGVERVEGMRLIRRVLAERQMILMIPEAYMIYASVLRTNKVPGDVAEVGVFQGGSSKLICEAKGERPLHLFDTFEGLPQRDEIDPVRYSLGKYACSIESVRKYLGGYSGVQFYRGFFPETAGPVADRVFSFVHLDVDLYQSTRDSLRFFYPRMSVGGVILSHDYIWAAGVRKAFDEFFCDKPEPVIELCGSQCMVMKAGNA